MKRRFIAVILFLSAMLFSGCSLVNMDVWVNEESLKVMLPFLFPTKGITISSDGIISISTDIEDNKFSYVVLQLWEENNNTCIMDITSTTNGKQNGVYIHRLESGTYIIKLKANSNKQDEAVTLKVRLVEGEEYAYSFNVKSFNDKQVTISDFIFEKR